MIDSLQDLPHLDNESRFKTPGISEGNWTWRKTTLTINYKEPEGAMENEDRSGGAQYKEQRKSRSMEKTSNKA